MRLICPNCSAQYEVDDAVIPSEGRDVQCSNCSTTWFQQSADALRARPDVTDAPDSEAQPASAATAAAMPPPAGPPEGMKRREIDPSVLDVLREEADRERKARHAEGSAIETQADLGLTPPAPSAPAAEEAERPDRGTVEPEIDPALVPRASRRDLLPDIEEINSTLRATSERDGDAAAMDAPETLRQRRSGFRRGFLSSVSLMVLLLLPYVFAAPLAQQFPAAASWLISYSARIDGLRLGLEDLMQSTTDALRDAPPDQG